MQAAPYNNFIEWPLKKRHQYYLYISFQEIQFHTKFTYTRSWFMSRMRLIQLWETMTVQTNYLVFIFKQRELSITCCCRNCIRSRCTSLILHHYCRKKSLFCLLQVKTMLKNFFSKGGGLLLIFFASLLKVASTCCLDPWPGIDLEFWWRCLKIRRSLYLPDVLIIYKRLRELLYQTSKKFTNTTKLQWCADPQTFFRGIRGIIE